MYIANRLEQSGMKAEQLEKWLPGIILSNLKPLSSRLFYLSYSCLTLSSIRARLNKIRTAFCNSAYVAIDDLERATNTISHPGLIALRRTISRNRRLTLFLTTAFPTLLP